MCVSYHVDSLCTTVGLRYALTRVVHDILLLSEDEPYGVRGATIFLRMKNCKDEEKYLGSIAMDTSTVKEIQFPVQLMLNSWHLVTNSC